VAVSRVVTTGVGCTNTVGANAISPTSDGNGYFVGDNNGDVYAYGDAPSILSQSGGTIRIAGTAVENGSNGSVGGGSIIAGAGF
jgi:hypothetical protein